MRIAANKFIIANLNAVVIDMTDHVQSFLLACFSADITSIL